MFWINIKETPLVSLVRQVLHAWCFVGITEADLEHGRVVLRDRPP